MDGIIVDKKTRLLKLYYKIFFPVDEIAEWLSYGDGKKLKFREFAYTTVNGAFKRYISFDNREEMVKTFYTEAPAKVDISAIYNVRPQYSGKSNLRPLKKELVFDIDLTDYDEVRICCSGTKICDKCWNYMTIACKILDASFREDWGFRNILWVYSGRRGIHVWVCDEHIQLLNNIQRAAIIDFFQLVKGNMFGKTRVHLNKLHFSVRRALKIIEPYFIPLIVIEQDMLGNKQRMDKFLDSIPTKETRNEVGLLLEKYTSSLDRWQAFLIYIKTEMESMNKVWLQRRYFVEETILRYSYPRLDVSVTTGINHLLKLPFSVHPETGKIAIALDLDQIHLFKPNTAPTMQSIWNEKIAFNSNIKTENKTNKMSDTTENMKEYEKTSLKHSVNVFKNFLANMKTIRLAPVIDPETESKFERISIRSLRYY
ncbi:hypothetical protein PV327_009094 [Microctonus hyperodae]|uniref:DNA primase n=2 Tax=Microctonus hyperodae TaxID=165561 RepID=A0AA39FTS4_MICHY|nr:hypothetical protein PV327_009094 [Microctonus hyperodae]